jgi:hypothetical protein
MNERVQQTLNTVLKRFKTGDIPTAVAYSMLPFPAVPSARWSILNRTIMFLSGTMDARGIRQWNSANRYVKPKTKALYILVPYLKKIEEKDEDKQMLFGFGTRPVFRVEDTEGEDLEYENIQLPKFPLMDRAKAWGVSVKAIPGNYRYAGYYSIDRQEIALATKDECVFFHELAHCAHGILKGGLQGRQEPLQEIVAQLSAQCLCRLVGKSADKFLGTSYRYIEHYAEKLKLSPLSACTGVLNDVERVLNLILNGHSKQSIDAHTA